jgi:hypothetical protein
MGSIQGKGAADYAGVETSHQKNMNDIDRNLAMDTVGAANAEKYFPKKVKPTHESTDYVVALSECNPEWTDEDIVRNTAFVYLQPKDLFRLWLDALTYKYLKRS